MKPPFSLLFAPLITAAALIVPAGAQDLPDRPEPIAEVMVLGTYHFANPGRDKYNAHAEDVTAPGRQAEIEAVVDRLAAFQPTAIAVEMTKDDGVQAEYEAWRAGEAALSANEIHQIGFRLAKRAGLETVAPIDDPYRFRSDEEMALEPGDPWLESVEADTDRLGESFTGKLESLQQSSSIGEVLAWMNTEAALDANSDFYLAHNIRKWQDDNAGGAHTVANWYTRNILIFQNIVRLAESGEEGGRIFVLIGQGHAPILRYLIEESPLLTLADPLDYLPEPPETE